MIWEKTDIDPQEVKGISERYGVDTLLSSILLRRGIKSPDEIKFLLEDDTRFLYNPFLFKDMEGVIDRIHSALEEEERVLVYGDKDVDGVTSCVILYETLLKIGLEAFWQVPVGDDSYGLSVKSVEEAYEKSVSLIITVDCGISAFEPIERARELGIDVIILDHHNSRGNTLPKANYIINPKLQSCSYPFKGLAACGVVSKVLWALSFSFIDTLYKQGLSLLHPEERDGTIYLTVIKLYNLVEVERIEVDVNESGLDNFLSYLKSEYILVYNANRVNPLLGRCFGKGVEFNFMDIKSEIERVIPSISPYSLEELTKYSRIKKYSREFAQVDTLKNLFITYVLKRYSSDFDLFEDSLDLVALGTVADLMPLNGENRIIVKQGLKKIETTKREGLRALLLKQNLLGKSLKSRDLSWSLAPIINSAGRMKRANMAVELLLCPDVDKKNKLVLDISAVNRERRDITEASWNKIYSDMHDSLESFKGRFILIFNREIIKGITGLLASRALSTFNVPVVVLTQEKDLIIGSIRSSGNLKIQELFSRLYHLLEDFGGHSCAAGFSFKKERFSDFEKLLKKLILKGEVLDGGTRDDKKFLIDANIPKNYLNPDIIKICDAFEPFGEDNPPLGFVTKDVKVLEINFVGKLEKKHLRLLLEVGEFKWPALFWNGADKVGTLFTKGDSIDIAYKVERNFFGGNETLQLNILDVYK